LKPETRERLLAGVDRATAKLTQFPSIEGIFFWLWKFSGRLHRKLENVHTREQIAALLDAEPEPSAEEILMFESVIRFAPFLLNRFVKKVAKESIKRLPENPSGPKPVIEGNQKPAICAFIGALYAKGVSIRDAQKRAAMKWNISLRSVERIWAKRTASDGPGESIEDVQRTLVEWWQSPT
jgi:hypothetical protein